jgi:hypothetical protein
MKKKIITWIIVVAVVAGLGLTAHMLNLVEVIRKMHGG